MATRYSPRTKPFRHQAKASLRAVREGNLAFLMEPGCGKTKAALDAVAMQALRGKVERVVVLGPIAAIDNVWEDEIETHYPWQCSVETFDTQWVANEHLPITRGVCFYLLNYDKVSRRQRIKGKWEHPYWAEIEEFDPDLIILDESHRCKSAGAVRSQKLWRYVRARRDKRGDGKPYVYLLTGTPQSKGYIDFFAQYRIMDADIFGTAKHYFEDRYCIYGRGREKFKVVRYRNKRELLKKINSHAFIITKDKALDLPPVLDPTFIHTPLPPRARKLYMEMAEDMVTWIEKGEEPITAANAGAKRIRLQQIAGGFTTDGKQIHDEKVKYLKDRLEDLCEAGENVLVYARFLPEVRAAHEAAQRAGYTAFAISGSTPARDRKDQIREFQRSTKPIALVFQVSTGSLAYNLTAASHVVFYSLPDSWVDYWQALSRVDRQGQRKAINHYYLVAPGTLDARMLRALREKRDMHAEIMGNPQGFLLG